MGTAIFGVQDTKLGGVMSAASLVFRAGSRPSRAELRELAARDREFAISLEPELPPITDPEGRTEWVELVMHGLTFDLSGLAPRDDMAMPEAAHLFGLPRDLARQALEAMTLVPGPHLAGGRMLLPVLRSHALLAARLTALPGVVAVAWHPARSWSAPEYFRNTVLRWIEGGAFPGLGLAALAPAGQGGLVSEGLSLFTGQELMLDQGLAQDRASGARIALRLMHWLVENGTLEAEEILTGPGGEHLRLEPSEDRRLIMVWKT